MGIYEFVDNFSMSLAGKMTKNTRYFSKSVESKTIAEWFEHISIDDFAINGEGYYPVNVHYEGKTEEAAFKVEQWKGDEYPTIIYHHGAAEGSYDFSFMSILGKSKKHIDANLIAIQALFNHSNKEFMESIAYLEKYTVMISASVLIVDKLIEKIRKTNTKKIVISGASLGAIVTNLHFAYYNTADLYKPLLGGTRVAEVFIDSAYSNVTSDNGKMNPDKLRKVLNFNKDFCKRSQDNLYSLMGKYDQILKYDTQSIDLDPKNVKVIPFGHATGATKYKILRQHILEGLCI